jgi:hypothetical protein
MEKHHRQHYFNSAHLRYSLFFIVLISLLTILLFSFAVRLIGEFLEDHGYQMHGNIPALIIVIIGYAAIVFALTYYFSHRFIGPFERLKTDMSIILGGFYHRRLLTRDQDDIYIRSFVNEVNTMLDEFESLCISRQALLDIIKNDMKGIMNLLDDQGSSKEDLRESLSALQEKLERLTTEACSQPGK